jgi:hypothetical protein
LLLSLRSVSRRQPGVGLGVGVAHLRDGGAVS